MYNYNPMPSASPLRLLPSLPIIYTHLDIHRSDTIAPTENDNNIIPRPLCIRNVKQSPSMPFRKSGRGGQEGKEKDGESKRVFIGTNLSQSSRARSSSAGVLGKDRDKGKPDGDGDFNHARNFFGGKGAKSSPNGTRMPWLQRLVARQTASVCNHDNGADQHLRENSVQIELKHSEGKEPHDSTSQTGEDACLLPYSDDQCPGDKHRKNTFLRWAASTRAKYDKSARRRLEQRRLGRLNLVLEETLQQIPHQEGGG